MGSADETSRVVRNADLIAQTLAVEGAWAVDWVGNALHLFAEERVRAVAVVQARAAAAADAVGTGEKIFGRAFEAVLTGNTCVVPAKAAVAVLGMIFPAANASALFRIADGLEARAMEVRSASVDDRQAEPFSASLAASALGVRRALDATQIARSAMGRIARAVVIRSTRFPCRAAVVFQALAVAWAILVDDAFDARPIIAASLPSRRADAVSVPTASLGEWPAGVVGRLADGLPGGGAVFVERAGDAASERRKAMRKLWKRAIGVDPATGDRRRVAAPVFTELPDAAVRLIEATDTCPCFEFARGRRRVVRAVVVGKTGRADRTAPPVSTDLVVPALEIGCTRDSATAFLADVAVAIEGAFA